MQFVCIPGSVQDVGYWGKNLHSSEDWDSLVYLATDKERERERERGGIKRIKDKNTVTMYIHLFPKLKVRRRDTGSFRQFNTQTPRSCLCGWVSCQSKQGTPTGLQVQQAVS